MKYCAALLFGLCLFAGPVAAQTDTDKSKGTEAVNATTGQTGDAQPVKKKPLPSSRQAVAKGGSDSGAREPKKLAAKKKAPAETKTVPGSGEITSGQGGDEALAKKSTAKTEAGGDAKANASSDKTEAGQTPKKKSVKKAPADTKKEATGTADASGDQSGDEPSTEKKSGKKSAAAKKNSGATAIVKEGGKHCSGLDEYRVCW